MKSNVGKYIRTPEIRAKLSNALKGFKHSKESNLRKSQRQ